MSASITDEQFAARELVRSWAAASGAVTAARDVELGQPDAWRVAYDGLAQLGIFGVALSEEQGGADGTVEDLCAMVDEAAAAMVPGPVATTALATLMIERSDVLESLISGERVAGVALSADVRFEGGRASGTAEYVLGADPGGVLLLPAGDSVVLIDAGADGVSIEPLKATDFSRPLARVVLDSAPAEALSASPQRLADVAATVLAAEAAGLARWTLQTATDYAKVREQFGKPIGSFQAIKHMCAEMLLRSEQASVAAVTQHEPPPPYCPIPTNGSCRSLRRWPRPPGSTPRRPTPRTAFRCSAVSESPGNTTRISICDARTESHTSSAARTCGCTASRRSPSRACAATCASTSTRSNISAPKSPPR